METFESSDAMLDFAIQREQEAHDFYKELAGKVEDEAIAKALKQFAGEELGHKKKLLGVKAGKIMLSADTQVQDLKIGDYLVDIEASPDMTYQDVLVMAMKKEKAAFKMYTDLAGMVGGELSNLFLALANEEAKHKLRFEIEYDDVVMRED